MYDTDGIDMFGLTPQVIAADYFMDEQHSKGAVWVHRFELETLAVMEDLTRWSWATEETLTGKRTSLGDMHHSPLIDNSLEKFWTTLPQERREEVIIHAARVAAVHSFEHARAYAPELTLQNLAADNGRRSWALVEHFLLPRVREDMGDEEIATERQNLFHAGVERLTSKILHTRTSSRSRRGEC